MQRIGRYRVVELVGTGGFSTVYRAVDERLEDTVAVKVLAENHSLDPDMRERFLAEGRVLRRIDDPHVVRVYDLGETDRQQPYLVLEYADRGTLAARVAALRRAGWRPTGDDLRVLARALVASVDAVHRADVVHRDLSPGNVLLASRAAGRAEPSSPGGRPHPEVPSLLLATDERLLLADLGLCKDLARNSGHTAAGGTEGFRPPEQRGAPTIVTTAADLWSLSALMVWLVTGEPPDDEPTSDRIRATGLPGGLGVVLDRSLATDPVARHSDPAAWLEALEDALRPAPGSDPPPVTATANHPHLPAGGVQLVQQRGRRHLVPLLAVAAVVVALGVALLVWDRGSVAGPTVTHLDGGDVRVSRSDGGTTVAIVGPGEIAIGEPAVFSAEVDSDVDQWVWVTPEGELLTGAPRLQVQASSAGVATVTLIAVTPSGEWIPVSSDLQVRGSSDG